MIKSNYKGHIIFHIDMNAFFASVAEILDPKLKGKAFVIGRENSYKGVIATASYEARKYGIGSAMSLAEAFKKYPKLIVVELDYKHYLEYHYKFINLIKEYTNIIEVASIDELYADMTEISKTKHPLVLAKEIQYRILHELRLPCSIGIGPTLFLAKMGSDIKKPLGVTVIRKSDVKNILGPLSVKEIFGIGKKTYPILIENKINTINDFLDINNKELIINLIGEQQYNYVINALMGKSSNIVETEKQDPKSVSTMVTFDVFKNNLSDLLLVLRKLVRELVLKLKEDKFVTKTIVLTLRDSDFKTISRRVTLNDYTDDYYELLSYSTELLEEYFDEEKEYRLIGIGFSNLESISNIKNEYNLFTHLSIDEKEEEVNKLLKSINDKYGNDTICFLKDKKMLNKN